MPFAITLRLDPVSARPIEHMWRMLADAGIDSERQDLGYAPHVTFGIYPGDAPVDRLEAAFGTVVSQWRALPVTLGAIGVFPGPSSVLYVAPVVTRDLLALHATVCDALAGVPVDPHYLPEAWMPHVTLSGAITHPGQALAALSPGWQPIAGMLDQADLVHFRPVRILCSHALLPHSSVEESMNRP